MVKISVCRDKQTIGSYPNLLDSDLISLLNDSNLICSWCLSSRWMVVVVGNSSNGNEVLMIIIISSVQRYGCASRCVLPTPRWRPQ